MISIPIEKIVLKRLNPNKLINTSAETRSIKTIDNPFCKSLMNAVFPLL